MTDRMTQNRVAGATREYQIPERVGPARTSSISRDFPIPDRFGARREASISREYLTAQLSPVGAQAGQMEARLRHLGATLDRLASEAESAGTDMLLGYKSDVGGLYKRLHEAQAVMDELRGVGNEDWRTVKAGVDNAWLELDLALRKVQGQ